MQRNCFAGGVLGTIPLLLKLKGTTLPNLSEKIGFNVRTNSESLMGVVAPQKETVFSDGVAIGSILLQTNIVISNRFVILPIRFLETADCTVSNWW